MKPVPCCSSSNILYIERGVAVAGVVRHEHLELEHGRAQFPGSRRHGEETLQT